jgi:hypothetical protein
VSAVSEQSDNAGRLLRLPLVFWGVFTWVVLGAAPGSVRTYRRGRRQVRDCAKRCGAYEGRVVARRHGAGVFGGDPYWEQIVSLRRGGVAEVEAEIARSVERAGYVWGLGIVHGAQRSFFGDRNRPDVRMIVAPADGAPGRTTVNWHFLERRDGQGPA